MPGGPLPMRTAPGLKRATDPLANLAIAGRSLRTSRNAQAVATSKPRPASRGRPSQPPPPASAAAGAFVTTRTFVGSGAFAVDRNTGGSHGAAPGLRATQVL